MIGNYTKVMWRHMARHKVNSFINILGLTTGITFALVIGVYVLSEMQVNKQLKDVDRLFIFEKRKKDTGAPTFYAPAPMARVLKEEYPHLVENYYRFFDRMVKVSHGDKHFVYQSMVGDSTLLSMTGFTLLHGNAVTALSNPYDVVITEDIARQLFAQSDVVGESVTITSGRSEKKEFRISGVLPTLSNNSVTDIVRINARVFMSFRNIDDFQLPDPEQWNFLETLSYVKLAPGVNPSQVEEIATRMAAERIPPQFVLGDQTLELKTLSDYYLLFGNGAVQKMIYILSGIAAFILVLASINFVNISISGAASRLKEIGVRKVIGSERGQIAFQFLTESIVITIFSGICSLLLYELSRDYFADLLATPLPSVRTLPLMFFVWFVAGLTALGFIAGSYPSFMLSSYKSIDSMKGKLGAAVRDTRLSKSLITAQFSISIAVFIFALVIRQQIKLFLDSDLGYNKSYVLTVSSVPRIWSQEGVNAMNAAKQQFLSVPQVESASLSWEVPNGNSGREINLYPSGADKSNAVKMPLFVTDEDYQKVFQLQVVEGEFYHGENGTWQAQDLVINEAASKALNLHVGDKAKVLLSDTIEFTVKGIVKNFNHTSLREAVGPMCFLHPNEVLAYRFFSFRLQPGNIIESVSALEHKWREVFPDDPFDYAFMEDRLADLYKSELKLRKAASLGTGIMTIIVCVGLLGIVSLSVSRRTKEIGVRKVLGASVWSILFLFSKEYMIIVLVALVIAVPFAWYGVDTWLQGFAFRVDLSWWLFALPGLALLTVALAVVMIIARRAAASKPVDSLRVE